MPIGQFELEFQKVNTKEERFPVVIVAAGNSSRMLGTDKQMTDLLGIPVLARTLLAFEQNEAISEIVVVTQEEKIAFVNFIKEKYAINKLSSIVLGGNCREESVKNGLLAISDRYKKALVHDGARPLVSQGIISRVASALSLEKSVICGVKLKDTVKQTDENGIAEKTLDRERLIAVQTPQGVDIETFFNAAKKQTLDKFTDDASLLESEGIKAKTVDGDYRNIKITTPEDICLAEFYLGEEY